WMKRHLTDIYVKEAKALSLVSRAAFKLININKQLRLLKPGMIVVDLGASPGSWTQIARAEVKDNGLVISVDINSNFQLTEKAPFIQGDFTKKETQDKILEFADSILSDMAPHYCGIPQVDHSRLIELQTTALNFALQVLKPGGSFVCKVSRGGEEKEFFKLLEKDFASVKTMKPDASRKESTEIYYIAKDF
ncbi:hypothetical protein DICPUDRAFT_10143, partial [Dictyostelium purpureum]